MEGATCIDYIKTDDYSWMTIITPHQFIKFSLLMAAKAQRNNIKSLGNVKFDTIHYLCSIPRCPPMLLQLLKLPSYNAHFGMSGNAFTLDRNGMLPIHHAVQTPPATYRFVPSLLKPKHQRSLVDLLLAENPCGARVADSKGRLPVHHALHSGCVSEKDLLTMIKLHPESLRKEDPETGLLPFMLVAASPRRLVTVTSNALPSFAVASSKIELHSSISIEEAGSENNNCLTTERAYQAEWKKDHVRMSFLLLSLCPEAIPSRPVTF
eukprot:jgi/Psemu1/311026/fgenesh1_kg.710_\